VTSVVVPFSYLVSCDRTSPLTDCDMPLAVSLFSILRHQNTVSMESRSFFRFQSLGYVVCFDSGLIPYHWIFNKAVGFG